MQLQMRRDLLITIALLAALAPSSRAAESITLRNGFALRCDHHAQVEGHVRLFLSPGEGSYIEFPPEEVTAVDLLPDPPSLPAPVVIPSANPYANPGAKLSPADLAEMLAKAGDEHNLDVDLLASLVKAESGGNARAISRTGARGLMQLMPSTAAGLGVSDSFEPRQNVRGGSAYLDTLLVRYHDNMALALAAYNAGPAAVDRYNGIPPYHETRAYVARVIHEFNRRVVAREAQARQARASSAVPQDAPTR